MLTFAKEKMLNIMPLTITNSEVKVLLPVRSRIADFFQAEERVIVEWKSSEEHPVSLFDGKYKFDCGQGETITIYGKPGFCSAILSELGKNGLMIDKRPQVYTTSRFWAHLTGRRTY